MVALQLPAAADAWPAQARSVVADVAAGIVDVLGRDLLGLYAFGSLVTGDFDPAVSDVDLVAVLAGELPAEVVPQLGEMHAEVVARHPAWDDRVEVLYVAAEALRTFRERRSPLAKIGPGEPLGFREGGAGEDWIAEWFVVREYGLSLTGPPPSAFVPPIAVAEVLAQLRGESGSWHEWVPQGCHPGGQAYAVLTACRTLFLATHGRLASKIEAARWVERVMPEWSPLVSHALLIRSLGGWTGEMDRDRTLAFLRAAAAALSRS